ncbi:MAG: GNAT family N-acetyltransferase [Alphaproteobacteria bacterium]
MTGILKPAGDVEWDEVRRWYDRDPMLDRELEPWTAAAVAFSRSSAETQLLAYFEEGVMVAYLECHDWPAEPEPEHGTHEPCHSVTVAVHPDLRGRRIATRAVQALLSSSHVAFDLILAHVRPGHVISQRLCARLGFRQTDPSNPDGTLLTFERRLSDG